MDTDQGQEPLCRNNHSNLSPHNIPSRWRPLAFLLRGQGTNFLIGGNPWKNYELLRQMDTDQGRAPLCRGNNSNPSPHNIPSRGGPLVFIFIGRGTNSPMGGTLGNILTTGGWKIQPLLWRWLEPVRRDPQTSTGVSVSFGASRLSTSGE